MNADERLVRVWWGSDWLRAQFLREALLENSIDCYLDRDIPQPELGMNDVGLWVGAPDQVGACELIAELEAQMRLDDSERGVQGDAHGR